MLPTLVLFGATIFDFTTNLNELRSTYICHVSSGSMSLLYWLAAIGDGLDTYIVARSVQILDIAAETEYGPLMIGVVLLVNMISLRFVFQLANYKIRRLLLCYPSEAW